MHAQAQKITQKKYTIGYNGSLDYFSKVIMPYHEHISSVYSGAPLSMGVPNARWQLFRTSEELLELRENLKRVKVDFNLIFNAGGVEKPDDAYLDRMIEIADLFKPDLITFSNTYTLRAFLDKTDYRLNISIVHDINTIDQLEMILEDDKEGKITSYNIGRRKTYDLTFIREIRKRFPFLSLKLMVNEGCVFECPDDAFHSSTLSFAKTKIENPSRIFYCGGLTMPQYWRFLAGQYIPPKFLHHYYGLVDELKLAVRLFDNQQIVQILKEYIDQEDITIYRAIESAQGGNLFRRNLSQEKEWGEKCGDEAELRRFNNTYLKPYPDDFFKMRLECGHKCHQCAFCRNILTSENENNRKQEYATS